VLAEPLDVLLVLHLVLVIEDEEGLGVGIGRVPELEGRATLVWEFLLRPYEHQLCEVGPPADASAMSLFGAAEVLGQSEASTISTFTFCFPLIRWGIIKREVNHGRHRPLGRKCPPASRRLCLHVGRWHGHLPLCLGHWLLRPA
jgi:hypothetical protein